MTRKIRWRWIMDNYSIIQHSNSGRIKEEDWRNLPLSTTFAELLEVYDRLNSIWPGCIQVFRIVHFSKCEQSSRTTNNCMRKLLQKTLWKHTIKRLLFFSPRDWVGKSWWNSSWFFRGLQSRRSSTLASGYKALSGLAGRLLRRAR